VRLPTPGAVMRRVDDEAPQPGLQLALSAKRGTLAHRAGKGVLDGLAGRVLVAQHGECHTVELGKPAAIDRLDLVESGSVAGANDTHPQMTLAHPDFFSGGAKRLERNLRLQRCTSRSRPGIERSQERLHTAA
jgi:hypothetical protein